MSRIAWIPVLLGDEPWPEAMPLTTFETGYHDEHQGVEVPEAGGAVIDAEIAELVALLNRAGVRTFQSCQDIRHNAELGPMTAELAEDEDGEYLVLGDPGEAGRYGCIVVQWDEFPKVGPLLPRWPGTPGGRWVDRINNSSGWLFSASPNARYVSILFPWRDLAAFTEAVRAVVDEG